MPNTTPLPVPSQALYQLTPCRPLGFGAVSAGPATSSESVSALNSSLAFNLLRTVRTTAASPSAASSSSLSEMVSTVVTVVVLGGTRKIRCCYAN